MPSRRTSIALPLLFALRPALAATDEQWRDPARGRDLPVRIRRPATGGPAPVVLLSHGLGGSRAGLGYLAEALSQAGFLAISLQHPGTDAAALRASGGGAAWAGVALDPRSAMARLADGVFAIDTVARRAAPGGDWHGLADPRRIGFAGHSYGAWTVQHLVGQRLPVPVAGLPERRIGAGIVLSPSPPRGMPDAFAFQDIATPLLHVTGTQDLGVLEGATPADRLRPYRAIGGAPQVLAVLDGAAHASFAGEADAPPAFNEPTFHPRVGTLAVAFLRAFLLGDTEARNALRDGAMTGPTPADRIEAKGF